MEDLYGRSVLFWTNVRSVTAARSTMDVKLSVSYTSFGTLLTDTGSIARVHRPAAGRRMEVSS